MHASHLRLGGDPLRIRSGARGRCPRRRDCRMWTDPIAASTRAAQARFEENPGVATEIPRE